MRSRLNRVADWREVAEEAHYRAKDLAERCGVSPRQLQRFFQEHYHQSPQRRLNEWRRQKAIELIQAGFYVKELASRFGYLRASDFSRAFKRFHGVTPTEMLSPDSASSGEKLKHVAVSL